LFELPGQQDPLKPRILFLVPDHYAALQRKGVERMILERDEHGFFEYVLTAHPLAPHPRVIDLNGVHRIVEFDLGRGLNAGSTALSRLTLPARMARVIARLSRLVRTDRIDLIRATDPYLMGLLAWAVARLTGRPFCVSIHADYDKNFELTPKRGWAAWRRTLSRWCPGFVLPRADLVLPIRDHLAAWAGRRGARPERTRIIRHGIDLEAYGSTAGIESVRRQYQIPPGAQVVSFVGRLSRYNYIYDVLAAAERVIGQHRDVVFVLAGDGEEREAIEKWVRERPALSPAMRIAGFRPPDEVAALRVASSISLCLMAGFSLLEACAAGNAVIAYDVDWHGEVIADGVTGVLVRESDVDGLVAAVLTLLRDRALAERLGANARTFVATRHDERRTSDMKRECYRALLRGPQYQAT
jgi:glycosyltransferase involved in cell wall biosynthesis